MRGLVRAARWTADPAHRDEVLALWARAGIAQAHWQEDLAGEPLSLRTSPLYDPFITARLQQTLDDAQRFKLVRRRFDIASWIDRSFLDAALKDLQLEGFWTAYDATGKPVSAGARTASR